ncbi:MAG: dacB [Pseudonocardiales bacterium]|nr:dacB [Pseudonocardiales bacterium]
MARTRIRTVATVFIVALVLGCLVAAAFLGSRAYRNDHVATPVTSSSAAQPTPAPVLSATSAPSSEPSATVGPVPVAALVQAALAPALAAPALGPSVHAYIADAATGAVLLDQGGAIASAPASTTKLTTAAAVLSALPATMRISTRAVAGTSPGQVVLIGGGDPTLSAAPAGAPSLYPSAARLADLAAQITSTMGATPVTSIVVDTSLFDGPRVGPGWVAEDVPSDYASAITALMVDGGLPAAGGLIRSAIPELEAGRALATLLGVPAVPVTSGVAPPGAAPLGVVESAPILDLVEQMLSGSDNVIAEMLARQIALKAGQPATFAGATVAIRAALAAAGIVLPETLVDASGLSGTDRLSASFLVGLLRTALDGSRPGLAQLVSALPVSGWEGTLATRYQLPPANAAAGAVRAKTGTLTGVVTLAGTVRDATGRWLTFAIMTDQVPDGGTEAAEAALDVVAANLAGCGCR